MLRSNPPPRGGDHDGPGGVSTSGYHHPPALFQRLIILHDGLMPPKSSRPTSSSQSSSSSSSRGKKGRDPRRRRRRRRRPRGDPGSSLGEDASLEEHGEFVLYYHDAYPPPQPRRRPSHVATGEDEAANVARHATEEAVRFAGLCRALRSLPRSLVPRNLLDEDEYEEGGGEDEDEEVEEAEVVHLGESTLVYVPLELGGDVFAVAQVPRARPRRTAGSSSSSSSSFRGGGDPCSIRDAVSRMHSEFALLRGGGGVHKSLLHTRRLERTKDWTIVAAAAATATTTTTTEHMQAKNKSIKLWDQTRSRCCSHKPNTATPEGKDALTVEPRNRHQQRKARAASTCTLSGRQAREGQQQSHMATDQARNQPNAGLGTHRNACSDSSASYWKCAPHTTTTGRPKLSVPLT